LEVIPPAVGAENAVVITTVMDNYSLDANLQTEWGFSAAVTTPTGSTLFDTGPNGEALLANMQKLGLDPDQFQAVLISHDDDDHTIGLKAFLQANPNVDVFLAREAPYGAAFAKAAGAKYHNVTEPEDVAKGIRTTGPIDKQSQQEHALVLDTANGLIVMTGCAHPGIIPIIEKVRSLNPGKPIALVMGGFHLFRTADTKVDSIVQEFRRLNVQKVAPSHCSGNYARKRFKETYGADYIESGVGLVLKYPVSN
jgi:7,8-dihydropterin-6-yl-methyl-4-(beta-D-ribofuranosyl)aminobenzene 5'-phosphate synthase